MAAVHVVYLLPTHRLVAHGSKVGGRMALFCIHQVNPLTPGSGFPMMTAS